MKKFEYIYVLKPSTKEISQMGIEGWEMCGIVEDPISFVKEFWFKREISDINYIGLLKSCTYMRNVPRLQHRTIAEFAQFVEDVMSDNPEYEKYRNFDWNETDAIERWIEKFHEYCTEYYSNIEKETLENKTRNVEKFIKTETTKMTEECKGYYAGFSIWDKMTKSDKKEVELEYSLDGEHNVHAIFKLTPIEIKRFNKWYKEIFPKILKIMQEKYPDKEEFNWRTHIGKTAWAGSAGGNVIFMIRPTGLCNEVIVKEIITGETIDITDAENL